MKSKIELLGVSAEQLGHYGAVSAQVARAMAEGALAHSRADIAISITGIAGPGGAVPGKPVGLVYLGLASKGRETRVERQHFEGDRRRFAPPRWIAPSSFSIQLSIERHSRAAP